MGDAGQRALAAWHLSWPPALAISQTNWVIPILGQMLDDPYAAVRCVAERSLKQLSSIIPAGYDYTIEPKNRPPMRAAVWSAWEEENKAGSANLNELLITKGRIDRERYDAILKQRDERAVRLRE